MRIEIHYAGRATIHHSDGTATEYVTATESDSAYLRIRDGNGSIRQVYDPNGCAICVNSIDRKAFARQFRAYARKYVAA